MLTLKSSADMSNDVEVGPDCKVIGESMVPRCITARVAVAPSWLVIWVLMAQCRVVEVEVSPMFPGSTAPGGVSYALVGEGHGKSSNNQPPAWY